MYFRELAGMQYDGSFCWPVFSILTEVVNGLVVHVAGCDEEWKLMQFGVMEVFLQA